MWTNTYEALGYSAQLSHAVLAMDAWWHRGGHTVVISQTMMPWTLYSTQSMYVERLAQSVML
jgi:hypothetical protein